MTIVLLVLSLAIHLFTFFLLILFYQQIQKVKEERSELYGMREDVEELLNRNIEDMKQENQELKQYFDRVPGQQETIRQEDLIFPEKPASTEDVGLNEDRDGQNGPTYPTFVPEADETTYVPPLSKGYDEVESSDQAKVLSLSSQGLDRDEIARKLNIGKGEVDLFLKFYQ